MQKWDYTNIISDSAEIGKLKQLGKQGWELVSVCVTDAPRKYWFYLKKKLEGEKGFH